MSGVVMNHGKSCGTEPTTFVELFAGIGGFRVGLEPLGMRCVWACEIEGQARACYLANFPDTTLHRDIAERTNSPPPRHDMLVAGFPCQPFTRLGDQKGFEHKHGKLFEHIIAILRSSAPPMFLLENVPGLLTSPGPHSTLNTILSALRQCGYHTSWQILDSSALLPQHRKRIYIVGFSHGSGVGENDFTFPVLPQLTRGVGEILCTDARGKLYEDVSSDVAVRATVAMLFVKSPMGEQARARAPALYFSSNMTFNTHTDEKL